MTSNFFCAIPKTHHFPTLHSRNHKQSHTGGQTVRPGVGDMSITRFVFINILRRRQIDISPHMGWSMLFATWAALMPVPKRNIILVSAASVVRS